MLPIRIKSSLGHAMGVSVALGRYADITGHAPRYAFVMDNDHVIINPDGLKDVEYMKRDPRAIVVQGVNLVGSGEVNDSGILLNSNF